MTILDHSSGEPNDASRRGTPADAQNDRALAPSLDVLLAAPQKIRFGLLRGQVEVPVDFDALLPDAVQASFEGR